MLAEVELLMCNCSENVVKRTPTGCSDHLLVLKALSFRNLGGPERSEEKFSVSLNKDFIFQVHLYFSASFAFYFQVSYT